MKIKLLILTVVFIASLLKSQTAFYDAFRLKTYTVNVITGTGSGTVVSTKFVVVDAAATPEEKVKQTAQVKEYTDIINAYCTPSFTSSGTLVETLGDATDSLYNPFLGPFFTPSAGATAFFNQALSGIQSGLSSAGGLDVTNFADGVAKFLVERAKEEINVAFFQRLKRYFDDEAPEMRIVFANTTVLLDNFEAWDYGNVLITLREAFDKDLKNVLLSIPQLDGLTASSTAKQRVKDRVTEINDFFNSDEGKLLSVSLILSDAIAYNKKFPAVLNEVNEKYLSKMYTSETDFKNAAELLNIFSLSLSNSVYDKNYVSVRELDSLFNDPTARSMYLGLIYEHIRGKKIVIKGRRISEDIKTAVTNYYALKTYLANLLKEAAVLDKAYKAVSDARKNGESDISKPIAAVLFSANSFLNAASNIESINSRLHFPPKVKVILNYTGKGLVIAQDLASRNYNSSVVGIVTLITQISKSNPAILPKTFMADFVKYGSFASNIVAAESSEDVKKAIDAIALPVGSYSIKRNNAFNIAVNGYLGFGYDFENPDGVNRATSDARDNYNLNWNVSAPVGVSFNFALRCPKYSLGSISAFISVIDVGSLAHFRLLKDTVKLERKVLLKDIFCPGVSLIYGIPRCPVSLAFGYYYRPEMAFDKSTSGLATVPAMGRLNVSVLIDIPVVNITSKQKWGNKTIN